MSGHEFFTQETFKSVKDYNLFDSWQEYRDEILYDPTLSEELIQCYEIAFRSPDWETCSKEITNRFGKKAEHLPEVISSPAQLEIPAVVGFNVETSNQLVVLDKIHVVAHVKSTLLLNKLQELQNKKFNQGLITQFVLRHLQDEKRLNGLHKTYSIVEPIISSDAFGLYSYDPFCGNLKLIIQMDKQATKPLPNYFKLHAEATVNVDFLFSEKLKGTFQQHVSNSIEGFVHYVLEHSHKPMNHLQEWVSKLHKSGVYSINDLADWQKQHWERTDLPVDAQRIMFRDIHTYVDLVREQKLSGVVTKASSDNAAKEYAIAHNIERYFQHAAGDGNKNRGFLDRTAVKCGFEAMRAMDDIPVGSLLDELERTMEELCLPNDRNHLKSPFLGLLLYGPPGTGKTQLCIQLCALCGLTPVHDPIAATDANRPHVGETEEALRAIFQRAKLMPHLLHCLAIDEIDGITQKRTDKVSEHAISTMSELLALVGGIKAIPNLLLLGSTNRPHMMDDAMLRRLPRKFFVGRPSIILRKRAFDRLAKLVAFERGVLDTLLLITTNYHGAALQSICSQIRYFDRRRKDENQATLVSQSDLIEICSRVSASYQISIGPFIVANIFQDAPVFVPITKVMSAKNVNASMCTGRILIDLTSESFQVELKDSSVLSVNFDTKLFPFASKLVPSYVKFALDFDLEMIQYIDSEVLNSHAAFDEQTIQETLQESLMEVQGYQKSLLILDMDSLVGLNCSHNHSSMGISTGYSFSKPTLASWLFSTAKCAMQMGPRGIAHWLIVVTTNSFCLQSFKEMARFPKSDEEMSKERVSQEEATVPVQCVNCDKYFLRSENKPLDCSYHRFKVDPRNPSFNAKTFRYPCCGQPYSEGFNCPGCCSGSHVRRN